MSFDVLTYLSFHIYKNKNQFYDKNTIIMGRMIEGHVMILTDKVELEKLIETGNRFFPDMIKFCIDIRRKKV